MTRNIILTFTLISIFVFIYGCDQLNQCTITGSLYVSTDPNSTTTPNLSADICPGDSVTLIWETENAQNIAIEADNVPDFGAVNQDGITVVSPSVSTRYKLVSSSDDCQSMQNTPEVHINVYNSPQMRSLTAGPDQENVPNWSTGIIPIQVSNSIVVNSIDSITLVNPQDGNTIDGCDWNSWGVDKDGTTIATTPFPASVGGAISPAGSYILTATQASDNQEFMGKCIRLNAILAMTLGCPTAN
jgi:hypothetical protein